MKKKILLLSDDLRSNSGVGVMSRELVLGTLSKFDWVQIGGLQHHPEHGKVFDLSENIEKELGIKNAYLKIYASTGYGTPQSLNEVIDIEHPDMILHFTDPRFWIWLYQIERDIRQKIPLGFYSIWDDLPYPFYNANYYRSCDWIGCISKQTKNIVDNVWKEKADWQSKYVPHGINAKHFFPIRECNDLTLLDEFDAFKKSVYEGVDYKFIILFNNRNIHRKHGNDVLLSYREFLGKLTPSERKECLLIMHTDPIDGNGTDLFATANLLLPGENVKFSGAKLPVKQMNMLYNVADITINISSNEGFGLSTAESIMAGTSILINCTGGLQDQAGFVDENGNPIEFTPEFPSNHNGKYKTHGEWAKVVYPSNRSLQGSPPTPYIFDDRADFKDIGQKLYECFKEDKSTRNANGLKGRNWALAEGGLNSENMCNLLIQGIEETLSNWKPRTRYDFVEIDSRYEYDFKTQPIGIL